MGDCQQMEDKENCCSVAPCPKREAEYGPPPPGWPCMPPWQGCGPFPPEPHHPMHHHHHHHPPPPPGGMPLPPHLGGMHPPFPPHLGGMHPPHPPHMSGMHPPPPPHCGVRPPPHIAGMHPFGGRRHCSRGERGRMDRRSPSRPPFPEGRDDSMVPYLYYMDAPGLAEQVRLCFVLGGVPFVDKRLTPEEWETKYKAFSPTGTMPFMTVGNSVFSQSRALLLYAARRGSMIPSSVMEQTRGLTMIGVLADSVNELSRKGKALSPEERIPKLMDYVLTVVVPQTWAQLNTQIQSSQAEAGYAIGNKFTYVDAAIAGSLRAILTHVKGSPYESSLEAAIDQHTPAMKKIMENVYADARVIDYMRKTISCPTLYLRKDCWHADAIARYLDLYSLKYEVKVIDDETWNKDAMPILPWISTPYTSTGGIHACFEWIEEWLSNRNLAGSYSQLRSSEEKAVFASNFDFLVTVCGKLDDEKLSHDADKYLGELRTLKKMLSASKHPMGFVMGSNLTFLDVLVSIFYERLLKLKHGIDIPADLLKLLKPSAHLVMEHPHVRKAKQLRAPAPKLYYFQFVGMVEGCRLMFHAAHMPFEDITFDFTEWKEKYQSMSMTGHAPWIEVDGAQYYEISVINELVGELTGFQPETVLGRYSAKQIASYYTTSVHPRLRTALTLELAKREEYYRTETIPLYDKLEEMIKKNQTHEHHAVESTFTWVDFFLAGAYELAKLTKVASKEGETRWPAWQKIRDAVYALPEVQEYVAKVATIKRFDPLSDDVKF